MFCNIISSNIVWFVLQAAEDSLKDVEENFEQEKKELENKLLEKTNEENKLLARIESLSAESDFTKEQLSAMKAKYENIKKWKNKWTDKAW